MNTQENNKLIAEFMGFTSEKNIGWYDNDMMMPQNVYDTQNGNCFDELLFDTSWDWLMPVIKKVNMVTKYDDYNQNRLHIQRVLDDCINENAVGIDEVCKAVVEFINEYNKNKNT